MRVKIVEVEIDPVFHLAPPATKLQVTLTKREANALDRARAIAEAVGEQAAQLLADNATPLYGIEGPVDSQIGAEWFYDIDDNWVRIEHGCLELTKDGTVGQTFEYSI